MDKPAEGTLKPGWVFQINETHGRLGWVGAFVLATEIRSWGIQGFVCHVDTHEEQSRAYIRLKWSEIEPVGVASLVPGELPEVNLSGVRDAFAGVPSSEEDSDSSGS